MIFLSADGVRNVRLTRDGNALNCSADGYPTPEYRWRRAQLLDGLGDNRSRLNLTAEGLVWGDDHLECIATNRFRNKQYNATASVSVKLDLRPQEQKQEQLSRSFGLCLLVISTFTRHSSIARPGEDLFYTSMGNACSPTVRRYTINVLDLPLRRRSFTR